MVRRGWLAGSKETSRPNYWRTRLGPTIRFTDIPLEADKQGLWRRMSSRMRQQRLAVSPISLKVGASDGRLGVDRVKRLHNQFDIDAA